MTAAADPDFGLRRTGTAKARTAFVTLVTNDDYAMGAVALLRSLARTGTRADLVVLHTAALASTGRMVLAAMGARLV